MGPKGEARTHKVRASSTRNNFGRIFYELMNLNKQILEAERSSIPLAAVDKPTCEDTVNAVDLEEVEDEGVEDAGLQH